MSGTDAVRVIRGSLDTHETAALMAVLATVLDVAPVSPLAEHPRSGDRPSWRPVAAHWDGAWSPVGGA